MTDRIPVILDTDIGGDVDDTFALAQLLRHPRLAPRLVLSATGNTVFRARLAARLCHAAARSDVPIGVGLQQSTGPANQATMIAGYPLAAYPGMVHVDGVQALIDIVMRSPEPITIIAIAPPVNLAAALAIEPGIAPRCRLVGMFGSLAAGVDGFPGAVPECNVVSDLAAARAVFAAPWRDIAIAPLDSCGTVRLSGDRFRALAESTDAFARTLIAFYDAWWSGHPVGQTTVLFDTVAVHLAASDRHLHVERLGIGITDAGMTVVDPAARPIAVATAWHDRDAFERELLETLLGRAAAAGR